MAELGADDGLKQRKSRPSRFDCVLIGASAGGVEALIKFFKILEPTPDMFYVVALHVSAKYPSALTEILGRVASMKTMNLSDEQVFSGGHIYICPPGVDVGVEDGVVRLLKAGDDKLPHPNISKLFQSFAEVYGPRTLAVILSGTGSDGSLGAKSVKEYGGMVLAQDIETSKYSSMPDSARKAGVVDESLSPGKLAEEVINLSYKIRKPPLEMPVEKEKAYTRILSLVRVSRGMDFSLYKPGTLKRRIAHRMQQVGVKTLEEYVVVLRSQEEEMEKLVGSMLISVTDFFRDPEAFQALKTHLEKYLRQNAKKPNIRIWIPGCATGQEAYAMALLARHLTPSSTDLRIFATDLDQKAIEFARRGIYPAESLKSIPPEFHYMIQKDASGIGFSSYVRDSILFSVHDILRDPPLIKQDLISFRNVLIYLLPTGQDLVIKKLAFALNMGGLLFLGQSESVESAKFFAKVDGTAKIFTLVEKPLLEVLSTPVENLDVRPPSLPSTAAKLVRQRVRETRIEKILSAQYAPPSIIISHTGQVIETFGDLTPLMDIRPGVLKPFVENMFSEDLAVLIKTAIIQQRKAKGGKKELFARIRRPKEGELQILIRFVKLQPSNIESDYLVTFVPAEKPVRGGRKGKAPAKGLKSADRELVAHLEGEIQTLHNQLKNAVEDLESTNEELQSMNEELQSTNEELQSSNEELESSNEELRATNEELIVVNDQLRSKSEELVVTLARTKTLEDSLDAAIVVIAPNLTVNRYNLKARQMLELKKDQNLETYLKYASPRETVDELLSCIRRGIPFSAQIQLDQFHFKASFTAIRPSRQEDDWGVVIFNNMTDEHRLLSELEKSKQALNLSYSKMETIFNAIQASIAYVDAHGNIVEVNDRWRQFSKDNGGDPKYTPIGKNYFEICTRADETDPNLTQLVQGMQSVLTGKTNRFAFMYPCHSPTEQRWFYAEVLPYKANGKILGAVVCHLDVSERENWRAKYEALRHQATEGPNKGD